MADTPWDIAHSILANHFKGLAHPLFFGNEISVQEHINLRGKPRPYLLSAIDIVKRIKGRTIVEIGCMRQPLNHPIEETRPVCCNDGHSTAFWARSGLEVHSVDISPGAVKVAAAACKDYPNVRVTCADGIAFLRELDTTIDFLFLDAWDALKGTPYAERHLEAFETARPRLARSALVVIDDTDIAFGGKGRLAVPAIIRDGFDLLTTGRQTMLLRVG